jgi:cytochrome c-type biogenesis protein CcmE
MASTLDAELARAARANPEGQSADDPPKRVVLSSRGVAGSKRRGNVALLAVLLCMAGGIVALVMTSFKDAAVYAKNVDQVAGAHPELAGRNLRVEGNLVHGSLKFADKPCEYRFKIKGKDNEMSVRYPQCVVPDTFRDVAGMDVGVTVEGKLTAGMGGAFEATQVLAKCPSKYEMKQRGEAGEQMPHLPVPPAN